MEARLKNNVIWLKTSGTAPEWMDEDERGDGSFTALLNETTSRLFGRDFGDAVRDGDCAMDPNDMAEILGFVQNPSEPAPRLVEPNGIRLEGFQRDAVSRCLSHKRYALFFGMGTGKTLMAISILLSRNARTALVVTTKKMVPQYREQLELYAPGRDYEVTNYESLHRKRGIPYDVLILDESQACKNYMSNANVNCREIASLCPCCYLFTGTPQDKSRHEILAQLAILDWRVMPTKSRTLNRYFRMNDYYEPRCERRDRSKELDALISAYSYGMEAKDALALPPAHILIYRCPHPPAYYDELDKDLVLEESDGDAELSVVADTPTKLRTFLQQICDGSVPFQARVENEDGSVSIEPMPRRLNCTKDATLSAIASKVPRGICYFWFRLCVPNITETLAREGRTFAVVDGSSSDKAAGDAIRDFKDGRIDWLVLQERAGNAGLDLHMVNHVVFYDLPDSYLVYGQCKGRIRRKGQTMECHYHHLLCQGTVEEHMLAALRKKKSFTDRLFQMYRKGDPNGKKNR